MSTINVHSLELLAQQLGQQLFAHRWRLVTAESCTGGGISQTLTAIAGSSAWFDRGFVTYSNAAKCEMLAVPLALLETQGAVSEPVVAAMAQGALAASDAQLAVAVSGIAGPGGGTPTKPVGCVCFGWGMQLDLQTLPQIVTATHHFDGDRRQIRDQSIAVALQQLVEMVSAAGQTSDAE